MPVRVPAPASFPKGVRMARHGPFPLLAASAAFGVLVTGLVLALSLIHI